ncbi:DUF63 family protein [Natrinema ejinorense]|uniref:DUF63 domain-containing protein n=1 Tax=Natrinema ejinorense TaxID=373386 RepID=A0A2A5QXA2_9EURY|nr:DUF63 family protein [Natrinema ejinorense]PCR91434.1 DUF63 domain-containing protein [Natrinema ejinorense]
MVLPEGFVVPPWYLLVPVIVVLAGVIALLWTLEPPVTDRTVIAFAPWMMFGATLHVLYKMAAFPASIEPLFTAPMVYAVTAVLAGLVWIVAVFLHVGGLQRTTHRFVGIAGTAFFSVFAMFALIRSFEDGTFEPFWPVISVVVAGIVTAITWVAVSLWFTDIAATTSATGALVVFGHTLDGVTTAVGYDVLAAGETVPVSLLLLEAGAALPTAEYVGAGWLFVLVKVVLAVVILGLFREYVDERPQQARTILALVAAVGLGPAVHNTLLFTVA